MIIYLAGPMSGRPNFNFPAFDAYKKTLTWLGHDVVSPADLDREMGFDGTDATLVNDDFKRRAIQRDIEALSKCEAIALMPGWENSKGVAVELSVAKFLGLKILDAVTGMELDPHAPQTENRIYGIDLSSGADQSVVASAVIPEWPTVPVSEEDAPQSGEYVVKDSGKREVMETGSQRDSREGKGRYDLLNPLVLKRDAALYEKGAKKYNARNWELGQRMSRYLDSAMRHLCNHLEGDRTEDHLAAVRWNIAGVMYTEEMIERGLLPKELDDRPDFITGSHLASIKAANDATPKRA